MPHYRFFTLTTGDRNVRPPDVIECASDEAAIKEAKALLDGHDVQVWQSARLVIRPKLADGK